MPILVSIILCLLCIGTLSACAPSKKAGQAVDTIIIHSVQQSVTLPDEAIFLKPGQRLNIQIFGEDDLSDVYVIDPDMTITLPLIGRLMIANLNEEDIAALIAQNYRDGQYLNQPDVRVERVTP